MRAWPGEHRIERMKACLNGGRSRADHPAVPLTPAELAASAVAAVAAGRRRCTCTRAAPMAANRCCQPTSPRL